MIYRYWRSTVVFVFLLSALGSESFGQSNSVKIAWDPNPEVRVKGYNIYRSTTAGTGFTLLNREGPLVESHYRDRNLQKGLTYHYVVTAVDRLGLESKFSPELKVQVGSQAAPGHKSIFLPVSLPTANKGFQNTFIGIGLLNAGASPDQVGLDGISGHGSATGFHLLSPLPPGARESYLPDQMPSMPMETAATFSRTSPDVYGFFMAGTKDLKAFDGVTGAYESGKDLYFPVAVNTTSESTYISLYNPSETSTADLVLTAYSTTGAPAGTKRVSLPAFGTYRATLDQAFGPEFVLKEGYLKATANLPLIGFECHSIGSKSLSALRGLPVAPARELVLPQFFIDDSGGDTQLRLINPEDKPTDLEIRLYVDGKTDPVIQRMQLPAGQMAVLSARQLLGLEGRPGALSGYVEVSAIRADRGEPMFSPLIAGAFYQANKGSACTLTSFDRTVNDKWVFPVVMESKRYGYFTGLALLNPLDRAISLTLRAFDDAGKMTGETSLTLKAGERLVSTLGDEFLLGDGFSQMGGHFELSGSAPFHAMALFADQSLQFLSNIDPVAD